MRTRCSNEAAPHHIQVHMIQVVTFLQTLVQVRLRRELIRLELYLRTLTQMAALGAQAMETQCRKLVHRLLCSGLADVFGHTGGATPIIYSSGRFMLAADSSRARLDMRSVELGCSGQMVDVS